MSTRNRGVLFSMIALLTITAMVLGACAQATPPPPPPTSTPMQAPPTYTPIPKPTDAPKAAEAPKATEAPKPTVAPTAAPKPTDAPKAAGNVNAWGVTLPADAAPVNQQFLKVLATEGTTSDFANSVYKRAAPAWNNVLATPLVRLNKNFELVPAGAEKWEASPDGKTWTFYLDKNLKWSDGNPVTANDYVTTFQYQADPKHAWDFAWFWSDLVNWDKAVKGDVPTKDIGIKAKDDYTLQFTTSEASPYFPSKALYARPLSKVAFEKNGEYYNNKPETSVSSSPWKLEEWTKGKQAIYGPNTKYTGKEKPFLEKIILTFGDVTKDFVAYQNNEVDTASSFTPADIELISRDPVLSKEYHPGFGDFRTYYLGFNTEEKPFNDIKVRQAFAKAVNRDAIINNVVKKQGMAAYSFLMPGFPDANANELKKLDVNQYDPTAAKKLLADAGYPDGKGFPKLELWLREENDLNKAIAGAIASQIKDNLGIPVEISNKERKVFMDSLNAHKLPFYMVSYGFDYLDPSNMLGIWQSGGRHAWKNEKFDKLNAEASSFTGDPKVRSKMFQDAEKILVEDVPAAFIYHQTPGNIYRPYLKGSELEPDRVGITTIHWPGFEDIGMTALTTYIGKEVEKYRK